MRASPAPVLSVKIAPMIIKRLFDLSLAVIAGIILAIPLLLVWLAVRLASKGPALYWSERVGQHNTRFIDAKVS